MGTEVSVSFSTLRSQLENEKSSLCKIDESIKKIVQAPVRFFNDRYNSSGDYGRNTQRFGGRNPFPENNNKNDEFGKRKQTKTVFSRLSGKGNESEPEEEGESVNKRARVSSAVWRELPSRADVVRAQGGDEAARSRNRRMFGSLLGTLHKFKQEEIVLQTKEDKKALVERKIEEQARLEKERSQKERKSLFAERENKKATIKALEAKMLRVSEFEKWEATQKCLGNFILTKAKPHVYWLPKRMNDNTTEKLTSSKNDLEQEILKKRHNLQEELERIEHRCLRNHHNNHTNTRTDSAIDNKEDKCEADDDSDTEMAEGEKQVDEVNHTDVSQEEQVSEKQAEISQIDTDCEPKSNDNNIQDQTNQSTELNEEVKVSQDNTEHTEDHTEP